VLLLVNPTGFNGGGHFSSTSTTREQSMGGRSTDLVQGTLDMLIMKTLSNGSMHGHAVMLRIQQVSENVLTIEEGSLYPALHRIEQKGWIASEWGRSENNRRAKFYSLTKTGKRQLEEEISLWKRLSDATGRVIDAKAELV